MDEVVALLCSGGVGVKDLACDAGSLREAVGRVDGEGVIDALQKDGRQSRDDALRDEGGHGFDEGGSGGADARLWMGD